MQQVQVQIEVDPEQIKKIVESQLKELTQQQLLYIDATKALELTCMSKTFAENYVFSHPMMKSIERKRDRKRLWPYKEFVQVLDHIIQGWN